MSHFGLENEVNSVIRMDAPFVRGPQMRWQRKMTDSLNLSKSDSAINCSLNHTSSSGSSKTPMKTINGSVISDNSFRGVNGSSKTPGKTPHRTSKTPSQFVDVILLHSVYLCFFHSTVPSVCFYGVSELHIVPRPLFTQFHFCYIQLLLRMF